METAVRHCSPEDIAARGGAVGTAQTRDESAAKGENRVCGEVEVDVEYVSVGSQSKGAGACVILALTLTHILITFALTHILYHPNLSH